MSDPAPLSLTADFPPATEQDWRKLVEAVLKGTPFERLLGRTADDLAIAPLSARRTDARPVAGRPGAAAWEVMARIDHPDPAVANEIALRELENGANGLALVFAGSRGDHGFGLPANEAALARVLEGVDLTAGIAIEADVSPQAVAVIDAALARGNPLSPAGGQSPPGPRSTIRAGRSPVPRRGRGANLRRTLPAASPLWTGLAFVAHFAAADGRVIHNAGGSEAQELAFALAVAVAYLRALEGEGVALEAAARMIFFRLSADADQFLTIAKFRALRKLWARVETACGLAAGAGFVSAETAWRMMARRDPHVNILRATIAAVAAALGGADAITVLPFTAAARSARPVCPPHRAQHPVRPARRSPSREGRRSGRGLRRGRGFDRSALPRGWALFQEIEAAGGAAAALESGLIQQKVAAVRAKRAAAIARRQDALTGASIFPDLGETDAPVDAPSPPPKDAAARPLAPLRLAEPFEALRDASDRVLADTGARPKIFLANLGTPAEFTARATSPRTSSRPAVSRRSAATASTSQALPPPSRPRARRSPACARRTRSMNSRRSRRRRR